MRGALLLAITFFIGSITVVHTQGSKPASYPAMAPAEALTSR